MDSFITNIADQSKKYGVKSILKIADVAIKLGLTTTPTAEAVYEASKAGLEFARDYVQGRNEKRIFEFHRKLLTEDNALDEGMIEAELSATDFYALLDACISDIEEEKISPYATLTRSIALRLVPVTHRRHFMHSLKELTFEHLDILRETYTLTRYSCIAQNNKLIDSVNFLSLLKLDSISRLALKTLIERGLVAEAGITPLGVSFIESCYPVDDLAPHNFNYKASKHERGVIIKLIDSKEVQKVEKSLMLELKSRQIQTETSGILRFDGVKSDDPCVKFADYVFVIAKRNSSFSQDVSETLNSSLYGKKTVQIFIDDPRSLETEPASFMAAPLRIIAMDSPVQVVEAVDFVLSLT